MSIVLDANVVIATVANDSRTPVAEEHIQNWINVGRELHAPSLLPYEVANGLTRLIAAGGYSANRLPAAWQSILALPITYHPLNSGGEQAINIARQLRRTSAYDAAYIALAQELGAELWTFDGPLARNATGLDFPVHLLG